MLFIQKKITIIIGIFSLFALLAFFSPVSAQGDQMGPPAPSGAALNNYGLTESTNGTALNVNSPQQIVGTVVGAALSLLGVIFFLLIIYGGLRWMLAQGNEQEVEKAKEVLIAAIIGLVIVLSAYAITTFIGAQLTGGK